MSTQKFDEFEIEDPTPMMEVWRKDADEFGIPFQTQKGLIFLTAFGLRVSYQADSIEEWIEFTQKLSNKISESAPHISQDEGVAYSRGDISALLTEFAKRFMGEEFSPRSFMPASLREGQTFEIEGKPYSVLDAGWAWDGNSRLPDSLCEETWRMADWDEVMTSLCTQIGEAIHMNLEGAYLAGFLFFERQYRADQEATQQIAQIVSGMMPPKFKWFRDILDIDIETSKKVSPIQKIFDSFLDGVPQETPILYNLAAHIFGRIHFESRDVRRANVWECSVPQYTHLMVGHHDWFVRHEEQIEGLKKVLFEKGFEVPVRCKDPREAMVFVAHQVAGRWGYKIFEEEEDLPPCDNWVRRSCITYICVVNSVIDPDWNKFETSAD